VPGNPVRPVAGQHGVYILKNARVVGANKVPQKPIDDGLCLAGAL
jgi:hypothetical protein